MADLRHRPPQVIRSHSLPHLGCLTYSPEHELYAASRAAGSGTIGRALLSKNPATLNWFEPSPIGYDGPLQTLCWADHSRWAGDPTNATRIELTDRGTCQDVKNWTLPEDGWSTKYHCGITTDGLGRVYFSNEWYKGQIYRWENGKVTKHTFSLDGYDHLSEAVPVPGTGRITMIHAVSGKGRVEECLLELDMDTGRCRIAPLPGMGEGLELRWFTGDWLLVQGNGEILSDDLPSSSIGTPVKCCVSVRECSAGRKCSTLEYSPMARWSSLPGGTGLGRCSVIPSTLGLPSDGKQAQKAGMAGVQRSIPESALLSTVQGHGAKNYYQKRQPDHPGVGVYAAIYPFSAYGKAGVRPHCSAKWKRKSPITGRESPYTQALALWDELGLQGWLDEDEQTIKTIGVRVAAQGEYAVRQTFDGAVWIGSKDYREASWKDFAGFAHTLKLGGFTVYTRLPGPVPEEQSAQKAKLEALSAMVQISWKEPENKAAKVQKYKLSKPTEPVLTFTSFNFKLAVMEVLMYEKGLLAPKLDAHEFAREYSRRKIDIDAEGYEPIPEIRKWLEKYPVPERLAPEVTEIEMDGGSEIYTQLCPFWDGEDGAFDLNTITEAELRQFPNLKHITLMSSKPEQVLPVLERCGIKVDLL